MKKITSLLMAVLMLCTMLTIFAVPAFADDEPMAWTNKPATVTGSGTTDDPYCVGDYYALSAFATAVNSEEMTFAGTYFALIEDIVFPDSVNWLPIGSTKSPFCGHFDGCGHSVQINTLINALNGVLFGTIDGATISNLTLAGNVKSNDSSLCRENKNGTIDSCINNATIEGKDNAAGICCTNNGGIISNCVNNGTISGGSNAGGICATNRNGTISNCVNNAAVSGGAFCDGICAFNSGGTIVNCLNNGTVTKGTPNLPMPVAREHGTILSDGNIWIVIVVAVIALGGVVAIVIVKKKKKTA